jgi:peptide/nickel transport system substrate-binding protein
MTSPMRRAPNFTLDRVRARSGELPNHLIDELAAGRLDRREFLRRASVAGLSASAAGMILAACGGANSSGASSSAVGRSKPGGTLRVAQQVPAAAVNPLTLSAGGLNLLAQTGEYLVFDKTRR